jgi:3-phenylpropionate/trans-cinnamate dioxygenase ferredoxin reductase subunit
MKSSCGARAQRSFTLVYLSKGKVLALDCVNSVKDYVQGKALVITQATPDKSVLANPEIPIKSLLVS